MAEAFVTEALASVSCCRICCNMCDSIINNERKLLKIEVAVCHSLCPLRAIHVSTLLDPV